MRSAFEHVNKQSTESLINSTPASDSANGIKALIVFRKRKEVVEVLKARNTHITFGRSLRNTVVLSDPYFPRVAGEIILGPVPLLQTGKINQDGGEYKPMVPAKSYHIRPYTITLLGPGDLILNRNRKPALTFILCLLFMSFITSSIVFGIRKSQLKSKSPLIPPTESISAASSIFFKQPDSSYIKRHDNILHDRNVSKSIPQFSRTDNPEKNPSADTVAEVSSILVKNDQFAYVTRPLKFQGRKKLLIPRVFHQAVETTRLLLEKGDYGKAGRVLTPLLFHADNEQREEVIRIIDPVLQEHFHRAYILKPYDPVTSMEILENIVNSELDLLPTYGKAKRILETYRKHR